MFSQLGGRTHLFIWRSEKYLLDQIYVPDFVILHFKDDIAGLIDDDFRNQMYIKLIAFNFIDTEWFWIADADYLICESLWSADFFGREGKPYWFYRAWDGGPPEQRWRAGGDAFLGHQIPYLFLDEAQFLMNTKILRAFSLEFDLDKILTLNPIPADCHVYGAFAYRHFRDSYEWVDMAEPRKKAIAYKVNQQPPTYCLLEPDVRLSDLPKAKYYVFWSHWELAEQKMKEFLSAAANRLKPPVPLHLDETEINLETSVDALRSGRLDGIRGLHLDGWTHRIVKFAYEATSAHTLVIRLASPTRTDDLPPTVVNVKLNGRDALQQLRPGLNSVEIAVNEPGHTVAEMEFSSGIPELNGDRELFARLLSVEMLDRERAGVRDD